MTIKTDGILGWDLLWWLGSVIDVKNGVLRLGPEEIQFEGSHGNEGWGFAMAMCKEGGATKTSMEKRCEMSCFGRQISTVGEGRELIMKATEILVQVVIVGRSVITEREDLMVPLRISNVSGAEVRVCNNTIMGVLSNVYVEEMGTLRLLQRKKKSPGRKHVPLQTFQEVTRPFERTSMDSQAASNH
ncbi:hypothetical protein J437_LFUL017038 [Ladona fulva]|uniref:Uncharacterized protein n=1 Tax=Ladona fulva TaxID=123851 RepID=A0A8K0KSI5_LADFU|nr:hypothetical protein J437_LFUL017038 [Ladona fulva]